MNDILLPYKKLAVISLNGNGSETLKLKKPKEAIMITDLIISKEKQGRVIIRARDGESNEPLLFVDVKGTFNYSFPSGIAYWNGAEIEVVNQSEGLIVVTIGYVNMTGFDKTVWR